MQKIIFSFILLDLVNFGLSQVGVETTKPTETLHVKGEARIESLPQNGQENSIYTTTEGHRSAEKNNTFNAIKTVVADDNGVLGTVNRLPTEMISKTNCYASTTIDWTELADDEGVARVDMEKFSFEYRPSNRAIAGSNYLYVRNNTQTPYYGASGGERGIVDDDFPLLNTGEWVRISDNINYNTEANGMLLFWTSPEAIGTVNDDQNFYRVIYYTQKQVTIGTNISLPDVCINVTKLW